MNNNPIVGWGAGAGANYMMDKNRGCKKLYFVGGIVFGLLFAILGLFTFASGSLLGGGFFLFLGLLFIIMFTKELKKLGTAPKTIKWTPKKL